MRLRTTESCSEPKCRGTAKTSNIDRMKSPAGHSISAQIVSVTFRRIWMSQKPRHVSHRSTIPSVRLARTSKLTCGHQAAKESSAPHSISTVVAGPRDCSGPSRCLVLFKKMYGSMVMIEAYDLLAVMDRNYMTRWQLATISKGGFRM